MLRVESVRKRFATVVAVDAVSLTIERGQIFALLGPNGAGKTTLIRMILGLMRPDEGRILHGGEDRKPDPAQIGYLPEDRGLYQDIQVLKTLVYFGVLRGMTRAAATKSALAWLERMSLADRAHEPLKSLSKGNQQKVQFISAVLHAPAFAVLDEPFSGLDPLNQDLFLGLIQDLRNSGMTVLLSAHQMQLVERIADRIVVMNRGRTLLNGTLPEIRRQWATGSRLVLRVSGEPSLDFLAGQAPGVTARWLGDGCIELFIAAEQPLGPLLAAAGAHLDIREIESRPVTLHDVYVGSIANAEGAETLP